MQKAKFKLKKVARASLPTRFGEFEIFGFEEEADGEQAMALVKGDFEGECAPLVRIHSQCFTGDTLHSLRCDCGERLEKALEKMAVAPCGLLI